MTDRAVNIVYRNHRGVVKEYMIVPHPHTMRFEANQWYAEPSWFFDAEVVKSPDNVTRTFAFKNILEWKPC